MDSPNTCNVIRRASIHNLYKRITTLRDEANELDASAPNDRSRADELGDRVRAFHLHAARLALELCRVPAKSADEIGLKLRVVGDQGGLMMANEPARDLPTNERAMSYGLQTAIRDIARLADRGGLITANDPLPTWWKSLAG